MAKRFIDTDIFKKQFIRSLEAPYKLLWFYIINDCNHAGIWEVDFETAQLKLGIKLNKSKALSSFENKVVELDGGAKWFIYDFIEFQYGVLNEKNRVHASIIFILKKYNLLNEDFSIKGLNKGLNSPMEGDIDKDKDKDMDKDKDKEGEKKNKPKEKRKEHLFADSEFYEFENFEEQFVGTDYEYCDLKIYHEKIKNWSASGGKKKVDWIATARNFMISDKESNKLILKPGVNEQSSKAEFGSELDSLIARKYGN